MKIAPSMLACNFAEMGKEIIKTDKAGADLVHMDIMDGHFVPNISFGPGVVKSLRNMTSLPFDVHLMISNPQKYINEFANAGADIITFHIESTLNPIDTIKKIRLLNKNVGISFRPSTDLTKIFPFLPLIDVILVMTVEPGFGGQKFMTSQLTKIEKLKSAITSNNLKCLIEVDGGINFDTIKLVKNAGADICVAGTSLFKSDNMYDAIKKMKT